jgi:hypothetical protein
MFNVGIDFALMRSGRIAGSLEYYKKVGDDLMGNAEISAVGGRSTYRGNTASMIGQGIDIQLNSQNLKGSFEWNTNVLYSYTVNEITRYMEKPLNISSYMAGAYMEGRPVKAVYAYKWAGLNPINGNPQGYSDGVVSDDYSKLTSSTNMNDLAYIGSWTPTHFGSLRNSFGWNSFSFSFNLTFKLGYYFNANSINYTTLFQGGYKQSPDFARRWQKQGDEHSTQVPSMVYPAVSLRDNFYGNSEAVVISGNQIRLHDVRIAYDFGKINKIRFFRRLQIYAMASNVGLLWKANKQGIDPDYRNEFQSSAFSGGVNIDL